MHKHVSWDDPGADAVTAHYAKDPNEYGTPHMGMILSARYRGSVVRIRTQAYRDEDGTSIGEVVALIDPATGERMNHLGELELGDIVRLPDDKRAFEPKIHDKEEND